jgi:hypothetical protein
MNKRDFLKGTAALAATPAILPSFGRAATAASVKASQLVSSAPVPAYIYNSTRRVMTFYRGDDNTRAMHAYFASA